MVKYKLSNSGVHDTETGSFINEDPSCFYWLQFQEWLSKGNTPDPQYTAEELQEKNKQETIIAARSALTKSDRLMFRLLIALYEVGKTKGHWTVSDFPTKVRIRVQQIKQQLADLDELGVE